MCNRCAIHTMTVELQTALKIDASNVYSKITLVSLDSSLSAHTPEDTRGCSSDNISHIIHFVCTDYLINTL